MSQFQTPSFLRKANIYEANIRQYTTEGTFKAFSLHLPRLKDMGVEIIWLMPVHPIGEIKRKGKLGSYYSIKDFTDINPEFGTKEDFKNLIREIHGLGMKVIMDWVANHAAWDNVWTLTNPGFFKQSVPGTFLSPYDWDDVIQVEHDNPFQQEAMINAMEGWIKEYDIDGFRADLAHLTPLDFWKKARSATGKLKHDLIWLAETEEISYHEAFDISFTWEWMHATEGLYNGTNKVTALLSILKKYNDLFPPGAHRMFFTSNHDENSWNGTPFEKYGNLVKALDVFNCTYNSIPLIYSGQELPLQKRLLFFDKDPIDWEDGYHYHTFYKSLLALRARNTAICSGQDNIVILESIADENILGFYRTTGNDIVVILLNFNTNHAFVNIDVPALHGIFRDIFSDNIVMIQGKVNVTLPGEAYLVLEKIQE